MMTESQKNDNSGSDAAADSVVRHTQSVKRPLKSSKWFYRFWILIPAWALSCGLYFFFNHEPLAERFQATASFGASLGLLTAILFIFIHEIGSYLHHVHVKLVQPIAFHLWRYRWIYVLVPVLIAVFAGFTSEDVSGAELSKVQGAALFGLMVAFIVMWLVSLNYSFAIGKLQWLLALLLLPPLAIVFFFHNKDIEKQSNISRAVERFLDSIASYFWRYRWLCVGLPTLVAIGLCFWRNANPVESLSTDLVGCIINSMVIAIAIATPIALFKALGNKKHVWAIGILICPPLAIIFFFTKTWDRQTLQQT